MHADIGSRSIGLYNTSGLATPVQVFMDFLALTHLVLGSDDPYFKQTKDVVRARYNRLMSALDLEADNIQTNARYYTLVDLREAARRRLGNDFANWFVKNVSDIDLLNDLAVKKGVVLMYSPGFASHIFIP